MTKRVSLLAGLTYPSSPMSMPRRHSWRSRGHGHPSSTAAPSDSLTPSRSDTDPSAPNAGPSFPPAGPGDYTSHYGYSTADEHSHLRFCKQVFKRQLLNRSHAGVEQPKPAESWNTKTFRQLDDYWYKAQLDQCALGAWLPDQYGTPTPIKKAATLGLSDEELALALTMKCPGCLTHLPIEGSSPEIGNRAAASATYQVNMCKVIAKTIDQFLRQTPAEQAHAVGDNETISNPEQPLPPPELERPSHTHPS